MSTQKHISEIIPVIKANLKKFKKPGVLFVRPGYCVKKGWPTTKKAIVVVVSRSAKVPKLPDKIAGIPVETRTATELEQFSQDHPEQFSRLAEQRPEFRGTSILPEFSPDVGEFRSRVSARVTASRQRKIELNYADSAPGTPLDPVTGKIRIVCHASPDSGWPVLRDFVSATSSQLKVSMYDFTSQHILDLFESALGRKKLQLTLDDPTLNKTADQSDPETVDALTTSITKFDSAWALVRSSPEADTWIFPSAYHIKVMVRDSESVWLSSGNLNNSNQPEIDPTNDPQSTDQAIAKKSDRDWHVIIDSPALARTFESYLDSDFRVAQLHAANLSPSSASPAPGLQKSSVVGTFTFQPPREFDEQMTITPLLTPDPGVYQAAMLALINSVKKSLYIQLQYIHPTSDSSQSQFTDLIDAVAAKINDSSIDVKIILSEFQKLNGGLEALQAAGVSLDNVKIQNNLHNKGFIFDHKKVVVSSMNWSGQGVLSNRDAGVVIDNPNVAAYYESLFIDDWNNHSEQTM